MLVPDNGRASSAASDRIQIRRVPSVDAANAMRVPSGESMTLPELLPISNRASGGGAIASSMLVPVAAGAGRVLSHSDVAASDAVVSASTAAATCQRRIVGAAGIMTRADARLPGDAADAALGDSSRIGAATDIGARAVSSATRASPMSLRRRDGSRSRQRVSSVRTCAGVSAESCVQSGSFLSTAATVSDTVSPSNSRCP